MKLIIHTDGGARGNPGPAAIGVVIDSGKEIAGFGKRIGETTNNVAEYTAVIEAFEWIKKNVHSAIDEVYIFSDSTLIVNQLNGLYKVKEAHLRELLIRIKLLEEEVGGDIRYTYIPREQNQRADFFVNKAFDE